MWGVSAVQGLLHRGSRQDPFAFYSEVEWGVLGRHFALRAGPCLPAGSWRSSMPFPRFAGAHHDGHRHTIHTSSQVPVLQMSEIGLHDESAAVTPKFLVSRDNHRSFDLRNIYVPGDLSAIERQTSATTSTGMDWLPHRYKEFMQMSRQWAYLKRAKRAGRANNVSGVAGTAEQELAVRCWACPHDKQNLLPDWREVDKKFRFLYMLATSCIRRHLKNYVPEKDISTCITFTALLQKDTRGTAGLRTSGVGGFANMDYILLGALAGFALLVLTISYDISCQWKIRLAKRNARMPEGLKLPLDDIKLQCVLPVWHASSHEESCASANSLSFKPGVGKSDGEGISCQWKIRLAKCNARMPEGLKLPLDNIKLQCMLPVWHASSHEESCASANSLSFKPGVGKSDGEGIERTWVHLNPALYHTKDMGKGNRMEMLEDKIDAHNYLKNLGLDGPTEAQVRLQLKRDEEKDLAEGRAPLHGTSVTAFLTAGLQIEQAQCKIIVEVAGTALVAADCEQKIQESRLTTLKKLATFHKLQAIYIPGAAVTIEADEAAQDADTPAPQAEHIKLYMPSDLPGPVRDMACVKNLLAMEVKMCKAQCGAALTVVHGRLHAKRHLITFRNENITGQIKSTKARTLIGEVGDRVNLTAEKYCRGCKALTALKGSDYAPHYKELRESNIWLEGDNAESDVAAKKKLAMISAGRGARVLRNAPGQSKRTMSWIWTVKGTAGDEEPDHEKDLHESVRVKWARAKACKTHWVEEVMILEEEMRRTLRYLEWQAVWWEGRQAGRPGAGPQVQGGCVHMH
ncbi:CxC2 domain-containing protein [Mycena venus]|uniref:CxC2 domain-containing protein n=1 Tax=Mycena venus TaxID=2733690 RepID=A0A8H6X2W3_9AGAR|nr:CxC2 domain-containing protein [Mycena venus]